MYDILRYVSQFAPFFSFLQEFYIEFDSSCCVFSVFQRAFGVSTFLSYSIYLSIFIIFSKLIMKNEKNIGVFQGYAYSILLPNWT